MVGALSHTLPKILLQKTPQIYPGTTYGWFLRRVPDYPTKGCALLIPYLNFCYEKLVESTRVLRTGSFCVDHPITRLWLVLYLIPYLKFCYKRLLKSTRVLRTGGFVGRVPDYPTKGCALLIPYQNFCYEKLVKSTRVVRTGGFCVDHPITRL